MSGDATPERPEYFRRVALATVLPGAGLLRTSWRLLGWSLLVVFLAGAGYATFRVLRGGGIVNAVLELAVDPAALRTLAVVVAVAAVVWMGSIVLTAERAWPRAAGDGRIPRALFALLGCVAVALPASFVVRYLDVQADLVSEVFVASDGPAPLPTYDGRPAPAAPEDPWEGVPRVNLVLLGSDSGPDRTGVRTDSMMVVSIDTSTGDTLLVGIPRNLENAPIPESNPLHEVFPNGYDCGDECLVNGIWTLADSRPDLFPDDPEPGRRSTVDVLGAVTGLDLGPSVVVDLAGFRELVDAMGGVDVNVTERVCVNCHLTSWGAFEWTSERREWIEPGFQHLDGKHALWYARSRATSDDFSRMRRQRCVAGALLEQADPVSLLARYPKIASAVRNNFSVDISTDELPAWAQLVQRVQSRGSIRSLPLTDDVIDPGNPDYAAIHALVQKALEPPATPTPSPSGTTEPSTTTSPGATPTPEPTPSLDPGEAHEIDLTC